ncbi:rabenosyn-5 [Apis mellifera caucasica]|uniref:Rabenosyn-5 n=1 Tax=Apis mellifera TaxID=7460 RepID=A0A7M7R524_APIME|nr:rabenosyn-5 [Apis mellifera]KAG6803221.1 rabenosyn-5 [Apis mellifera caucasica]KAG9431611.1 rabenosyn-5 [Apis mellifera carnica]|eukprot:XP_392585.4 rabenosyn-5 [Apis mellifera]
MAANEEVLEGFICPICMTDFKTPNQLTKHFEDFHNDDPEILKSLKDLFGKAKKKILKKDEISNSFANNIPSTTRQYSPEFSWGSQEIGVITSHTKYFKEIRNTRMERYSTETNKLLIRLDKLLNNLPSDPVDRKVHERTIVPWIDEKDVKLCPTCAKSFHVARRKHHCRLCGAVMCHNCTIFLSLQDARKMTSPVSVQDDSAVSPTSERPISERIVRAGIGLTKLARSPSSGSLNSVLSLVNDSAGSEQQFRICTHCANLLDAREKQKAKHFDKPIVCQFYEKMRAYMEEASQHVKMYNKMWESLNEGESTYNLEDAQALRIKIAKLGESIDLISKRISVLGTRCVENPPQDQELRLHHMVRVSAVIFLKEELLTVQVLPSKEKYAELQKERQKRLEAKIAYERQLEEEQREKSKEQRKKETWNLEIRPIVKENQPNIVLNQSQGWGPSSVTPIMPSSMDPIIEQMSNLRAYIKQAKADCRYDEVATLESNLKELQSAYFTMKQSNNSDG